MLVKDALRGRRERRGVVHERVVSVARIRLFAIIHDAIVKGLRVKARARGTVTDAKHRHSVVYL